MQYPSRSEYCTSIRNPQFAFRKKDSLTKIEYNLDSNLVNGKAIEKIKLDGTKDIWSASGGFAIVFKFETFFPSKIWAIRCFYRSNFEIKNHYKSALARIKNTPCHPYFVDFSFLEEGIRVQGNCYPILKMEWVEGENLKKFIKANLDNSDSLKILAELWINLSKQLLSSGIAHGDLQHGNILIVNCYNHLAIKLIDYDSLYFFEDANSIDDNIKGLNDYQHPLRKKLKKRCLEVDFFPQLVIYISILALAEDKKLWETYRVDEKEGLLFSSSDFQDPDRASIFRSLAKLPHPLPELTNRLKEICQFKDFGDIPSLANVLFNEKEYIPNQIDGSPSWQAISNRLLKEFEAVGVGATDTGFTRGGFPVLISLPFIRRAGAISGKPLSRCINLIPSGERIVHLLRRSISEQTEKWKSILAIKFKWDFAAKTEAKSQNLEFRIPSQPFIISVKKALTDSFNILKSSASKVSTTLAQTKILVEQKVNNFFSWFSQVRQDLLKTYSSIYNNLCKWFYDFKEKIVVLVLDLVNKLKNIFQLLSSFSKDFPFNRKTETVWKLEAQLADSHSLPFTQQQLGQNKLCTESEDEKEKREIELKTRTTSEIASQLGCSVNWCNRQRYQYPDQFHQGTHYLKGKAGMIQWTEAGIQQLRFLLVQKKAFTIPSTSLTTKEASANLGIPPQLLSKIKAQHTFKFIEGTHYYIDARRRYYWTPVGIELLRQLQGAYTSESLHAKTKPSRKRKNRAAHDVCH